MRRKIHAVRTMQENQRTFPAAPTAAKTGFHTGSATLVDSTKAKPLAQALKIGVDLMGSDNAPQTLLSALKELFLPPNVALFAIGPFEFTKEAAPFGYISASDVIGMDEHPLLALRRKKNASIPVGMRLLKEGKLDAFVSAGNTGALVSAAKMIVGTLPTILRPSLLALMPTKKNPVAVLDLGANVEAKAKHLVQFAKVGVAFQKMRGIQSPKVGLLNIGTEALKGTSELRDAYNELKKQRSLNFAGNIEGKTVFDGDVDVLVTDGFTGNVFLKTAEGIAGLILEKMQIANGQKVLPPIPGAILSGIRGLVVKCHGYSTPKEFAAAVFGSIELAKERFVQKILNELS